MYFLRFWRGFDTSTISPRLPHHKCRQFLEVFGALQGALEGDFSLQSYWDAWIENVAYLEQMDIFNLLNSNLAAPETPRSTFTFMASDDLTGEHAERSEDGDDEGQNEEAESKMDDELLFAGCLCDSDVSNGADHTEQDAFEAPNGLNADQDHIGDIIPKASETFLADEDAEINADGNVPVAGGGELPRVDGEFAEQPDDIEEKAHSIAETAEQQQDEYQDDASSKEGEEDVGMVPSEHALDEEPSIAEEQQQDEEEDDASSKEGKEDCGMVPAEQPLDEEPVFLEEQQQDEDQDASSKEGKEDGDMIPAEHALDEEPSIPEEQQQDEEEDDASSKDGKEDCGMVPAEQPLDEEPSILEEQQQDEDQDDASSKEGKEDGDMIPAEQPLDEEPSILEEQQQDEDQDDASSKEGKEDGGMVPAEHALDEEPSIPEEQQQDEEEDDASSKEGKEDGDMIPAEHALDEEPSIPEEQQQDKDQDDASSKEGEEDVGMIPAEHALDEEPSILEEQQQDEDQDDASSKEGKEDGGFIPAEQPLDEEPSIPEEQQQDEDQDDASSKEGKEDGDMIPAEHPLDEEPSIPMPLQADVSKNPTDLHAQVVDEALADSTLLATADVNADALSTGGHQESGHMSDEQLGWLGLNEDGILEDETAVADDVQSPGKAHSEMDADCNSPAADSDELPGVDEEFAEQPDESEEKAHSIAEPEEQDDASSKKDKEDGDMVLAEHALDKEPSILEEQQQDEDQDDASSKEGKEDGDMIPAEHALDEEPSIPEEQQQDEDQDDASSKEGKEDGDMIPAEHALDEEPSIAEEQQQDEDQDDASSKEGKEDGDMIPAEQPLDEEPSIPMPLQANVSKNPTDLHAQVVDEALADSTLLATADVNADALSTGGHQESGHMSDEQLGWLGLNEDGILEDETAVADDVQSPGKAHSEMDADCNSPAADSDELPGVDEEFAEQPDESEEKAHSIAEPEEQQKDEEEEDASSKEDKEDAGMIPAEHALDEEPSIAEEQQQDEEEDDASSKEGKEDGDMIPAEQPLDEEPSIPMPLQADLHAQVVDEALADSTLLATADVNADALSTGGHQESGHMSDEQLGWLGLNEDGILEDETAVADDVQSPGKAHSEMDADCNSPAADSDELPGVDGEFAEQPDESEEKTHSIAEPEEQQKDEEEDGASSKEDKDSMIPAEQPLDEELFISVKSSAERQDVAEFQAETDRHELKDGIDEFQEDTGQMGAVGCQQLFQIMSLWFVVSLSGKRLVPTQLNHLTKFIQRADINMTLFWPSQDVAKPLCPGLPRQCERRMKAPWKIWRTQWRACGMRLVVCQGLKDELHTDVSE